MENKQMKMIIQNKEEGIDQILKHGHGNKNNYTATTLLSKEYELLYITIDFEKYSKHKFPVPVLKIPIQNNNIEITTQPALVDNTSIPINMAKRQNIVLYKKDVVNEIMLFLPHNKDSHKNLSNCHQKYIFSPTAGMEDSSLALLQYFPGKCCNYTPKQNVYHKYSSLDLNQMLTLVEFMYEMMKYLLQNIESNHPSLSDPHSYTLLIYLENIKQYLIYCKRKNNNIIKYEQYKIKLSRKCVQFKKPTNIIYSKNIQITTPIAIGNYFFNISTEQQNMQLCISKYKFNSFSSSICKDLATIYCTYKKIFSTYENTVSLRIKSWHIQNIALGYLLCKLLNNSNVRTLYLMRNLYFVIIMNTTLNLCIDINFKLQNGIFMVYDTNPYRSFTKPINWNINRSMLKRSCLVNTTMLMPQKCSQVQQLEARAHTNPSPSDLHILKMLKNYITLGFEASKSINHSCSNFDSESLISLQTKLSCISKSDKESEETMLLKELGQENVIHAEGAAGDTLFNNKINLTPDLYDLPFLKRGALFTNLCKQSKEIKARFNIFLTDFDCINEIIFERFTACEYGNVANQCWVHMSSQTPSKVLLKCLGQSLLNIFFGATL